MSLEGFFNWLCRHNIFHDYQENQQQVEVCTFCGKKRRYDSANGWMPK